MFMSRNIALSILAASAVLFSQPVFSAEGDTYEDTANHTRGNKKDLHENLHSALGNKLGAADRSELRQVRQNIKAQFPEQSKYTRKAMSVFTDAYKDFDHPASKAIFATLFPQVTGVGDKEILNDVYGQLEASGARDDFPAMYAAITKFKSLQDQSRRDEDPNSKFGKVNIKDTEDSHNDSTESEPIEGFLDVWANVDPAAVKPKEELTDYAAKRGDDTATILHATGAIERGSTDSGTRLLRGLSYDKLGDHEAAHSDARVILSAEPENVKARALYKLTRGRKSTIHLASARQSMASQNPFTGGAAPPPTASAARVNTTSAERALTEVQTPNSRDIAQVKTSKALTREALNAMRVKDHKRALVKAEQALAVDDNNVRARQVVATVYARSGDYENAIQAASVGLSQSPKDPGLLVTRAFSYNRVRRYEAARVDAGAAIAVKPKSVLAYLNRAYANAGLENRPEMKEDLRKAVSLDDRYSRIYREASAAADDDDITLLFGELLAGEDIGRSKTPPRPARPDIPYGLFGAIGFLFIGAGIFSALSPERRQKLTAMLRRKRDQADAIPDSKFWSRYDVSREVAEGGMGIVYEATDRGLGRRVAIKRMREEFSADEHERERFLSEARIVAGMRHPNIVEIFSIEEDGDDIYLVFEFVDGKTLDQILEEKGRISLSDSRDILRGVCAALDHSHARGVVHRDLKPPNIMVDQDGIPKVMDFGVARQSEETAQGMTMETQTIIGTPSYMAPEQEEGLIRPETDVYALGVCLYEMLSGELPFQGTPGAVLLGKREGKYLALAAAVPGVSKGISDVVDRALNPDPEQRFKTPGEFFAAYNQAVEAAAPV
jgi:tRNA A-37 threonylcarbamoyl transferase component Bud32/tetratricopeptide (TPR) repeat protein